MGERKVLCKYFPPDFDPKKVPRLKRDPEKQIGVRMMIPFSMQCNTCGEFMYRGKKFNSLKEDCIGEDYLTIRRFRFYIKCVICSQEITFKTDPEKGDYELETGASRNFESWTDKQATEKEHKEAREEEEKSDNMKQLENRTLDSKIELEIMDALDEIKAVNRRHETVNTEDVLKASAARRNKSIADKGGGAGAGKSDEVDAMIANIQFGGSKVRRLVDADDDNSDGASDTATDANGTKSVSKSFKGKGKKPAAAVGGGGDGSSSEAQDRAHTFQRPRKSGASSSSTGDSQEEEGEGAGEAKKADSAGSALVSAIEAQARREAEAMKAAVAGSVGTKVVVKHKKKRNSGSGEAASEAGGGQKASKKRKKHKSKEKSGAAPEQTGSSEAAAVVAPTPAPSAAGGAGLGGLNLLGSYASSSDSDSGTT